jgi:hypothetical protein
MLKYRYNDVIYKDYMSYEAIIKCCSYIYIHIYVMYTIIVNSTRIPDKNLNCPHRMYFIEVEIK